MRLVSTKYLKPGMILDKAVFNEKGNILINQGIPLTSGMIRRLQELGITFLYIADRRTKDIKSKNTVSDKIHNKSIKSIENTFKQIKSGKPIEHAYILEKSTKEFKGVIHSVLSELKGSKELLSLLSEVMIYDHYIFSHSFNVTLYSLKIGMELKLKEKQLEALGLGALLHDVGKMMIPADILSKPGRLTEDEFQEMKKHSFYGYELIKNIPTISLTAAHCALLHHERLDGSGYPRGVKGPDIHLFGKILAVADVFDAVTSNRSYRPAMLPHEGLEILYAGAGKLFDVEIINAFRRAIVVYPEGLTVTLHDGRTGVVARQNTGYCDRPVIRILEEENVIVDSYEVDLTKELDLMIVKCSLVSDQLTGDEEKI
ncbi:HD-GYP domain-containing protein (c-di-GMP phosphodiesterase class II) [Bacillus mesophilus]|uniref:HD-GYP domain-containing protein n=1 Tax=Bacillus mesophilus TaxID=1808955 RepID=A0A6M0Q6Y3_9BACI|nr:HD-GYP domain-containing protein [Bacillus mesophilus]MBM7661440.1 HD-GYP domain-containing protein (c-di-GMP phosphodiesterase class II) [Bacillus mesophilus]NEY72111.1 HD-GYP domain-containing protein [Bacillus mesophilus]